jgi:uncharacterized protein YcbK (DUF882 family)
MPAPEVVNIENFCDVAERWGVSIDTVKRVAFSAQDYALETGGRVWIISGARTDAEQNALRRNGRPVAPNDRSTHLSCPATGMDVNLGIGPSRFQIVTWGRIAMVNGLRWGGGGRVDEAGIPLDWQHVDRGPRRGL